MKRTRALLAILLACCLLVVIAPAMMLPTGEAITLPTTPPEVDDTPIEPADPPQSLPDAEIPQPSSIEAETAPPQEETVPAPAKTTTYGINDLLTTESILVLGLVIWYALTLVGIVGGRSPRTSRERSL